ncbi:MAG TPA: alpha/beta hydrolase [Bacteroidales bacterium]|nr:alpha/beta hydrolase [Bacteroidales bacterium]
MPYILFKGRKIYYEDQGSGECLLFVHEWNASSASFRKINRKYFTGEYRVVCPDLPGYGNSEFLEDIRFDDLSEIMAALLDSLDIEKGYLAGFCLGATILLDFYRKYPGRVESLVLIEPLVFFPRVLTPLLNRWIGISFLRNITRHRYLFSPLASRLIGDRRRGFAMVHHTMGSSEPGISVRYLQMLHHQHRKAGIRYHTFDLQVRCLCVAGEKSPRIFKRDLRYLLHRFPSIECYMVEGTKHYVLLGKPADVARRILQFFTLQDSPLSKGNHFLDGHETTAS